jgi:general secretion pathway protein A
MYLSHFNLGERPFSIAPDPRFLFMSSRHREALAHLLYGLDDGGGFVQLTGEVGTGKTTVCRCLLEQVPDNVDVALVLNPKVTAEELIATICDELGIDYPEQIHSIKTLTDLLNAHLLDAYARGRRVVLIIDEAQNLSAEVLEQVRLLTNLETSTQKLLEIILIGQPELRDLLQREDMRQLAQRVTARYHLEPISRGETGDYIRHRLQVCGTSHAIFTRRAICAIHRLSGGVPRLINILCDRAMLGAYVEGKSQVDHKIVKKAAREVLGHEPDERQERRWQWAGAGVVVMMALLVMLAIQPWERINLDELLSPGPDLPRVTAPNALSLAPLQRAPAGQSATVSPRPPETAMTAMAAPVPAVPEVAAESSMATLDELLQAADDSWYRSAWGALFAEWSLVLPEHVKPDFCNYARDNGLRCMYERGTWDVLRYFDRPVVMRLALERGRTVSVALRSLQGDFAELVLGDTVARVSTADIDRYWYGDYVLLLKAPPAGATFMKTGGRWTDVQWLREQLGRIQGARLVSADPLYFDQQLHEQTLAFQREQGLVADGVVGKRTIIHLNSRADSPGIPRLLARAP